MGRQTVRINISPEEKTWEKRKKKETPCF